MCFVSVENVSKSFGNQTVLNDLSLTAEKGEFVTLLGPSGCGKSTLLRILAGLTRPDQGRIEIDGTDVTLLPPKDRGVGMVFQNYALFPNLNVFENIAFGLKMKKLDKHTIRQKANEMVELVGLSGKEKAYPRELSGGQQQRVALARSLVTEPKVLLLDEPLSALDAQIRKNLQKQLKAIQQELNMTMVLVTHDQEEAMAVSDRIWIMNRGQIAQHGTPHEIYTRPANEFVASFIGNYNVITPTQFAALFELPAVGSAELYAIRPEAFSREKREPGYTITARVKRVEMMGRVIRMELEKNGETIVAEHLHQTGEPIVTGMSVSFHLHKQDVVPLS
jgi:putative spermidine/putrescine transport system ATP-binding protein